MNVFKKIYLKTKNRNLYDLLKQNKLFEEFNQQYLESCQAQNLFKYNIDIANPLSFKHSGNAGDIIYSLPTVFALSKGFPADIYLHLNQPAKYDEIRGNHPLKNVMLDENMFSMLSPLLLSQDGIRECKAYNLDNVHYDLDIIRKAPIKLDRGNIVRWYFLLFGVTADLSKPWLFVEPDYSFSDYIMIARSAGYHSPGIDYSFIKKYKKVVFVGIKEEFYEMRKILPSIEYHQVSDFLELAKSIAGSMFIIGNQSFPFSIAEALKVRRALEQFYICPNVNVEGSNAYDFCFQPQFEMIVDKLYQQDDNGLNKQNDHSDEL